jgi:hypothetical protein
VLKTCKPCLKSRPDAYSVFCYRCKGKGAKCVHHTDGSLEETYNHVDINVSQPDDLEDYLCWALQDYTMQSNITAAPMNTKTNMTVAPMDTHERTKNIVSYISSIGNITIARLYLDNIHKDQSFDIVEKVGDRLPRNIIALFDAEIDGIKRKPKHQGDIALMAIAAAADDHKGINLTALEDCMRDAVNRLSHLTATPPRSLEDILRYANGFLIELYSETRSVGTYNHLFRLYVCERYNETLFWAKSQLNIRRVSRSLTSQPKLTSPPLVESPPPLDKKFEVTGWEDKVSPHGSVREYFDRYATSGDHLISPKKILSPEQSFDSFTAKFGIKMLSKSNRTHTMLPTTQRRRDLRFTNVDIPEELPSSEHKRPQVRHSISKSSIRLCTVCEGAIFSSGKLSGTYERHYDDLKPFMAKKCIFCSTLYRDFLEMSMAKQEVLRDTKGPLFRWTIRSTAKSRESTNSIVVTFQALEKETVHADEDRPQEQATTEFKSANIASQAKPTTQRFHLIAENVLGHLPDRDELGPNTNPSREAGIQVSKWIRECDHNHSSCNNVAKSTWVPTRLLDLQFGDLSAVRLIKTEDEGTRGPYVTLSHCWGPKTKENEFLTTQGETEKIYMSRGIKVSELSVNFQQAISVARVIGVRYIWIDSLCIIQGTHSDFHKEGQLMHKVYRYSYCNIAAADSVDSRGGLFRPRDPSSILPGRYQGNGSSTMFGAKPWRIVPEDLWQANLLESSIYTRGWVFQGEQLRVQPSFLPC